MTFVSRGPRQWPAHASHRRAEKVAEEAVKGADLRCGPGRSQLGLVTRAALCLPLVYVMSSQFMLSQPSVDHTLRTLWALEGGGGEEGAGKHRGWLCFTCDARVHSVQEWGASWMHPLCLLVELSVGGLV